MWNCQTDLSNNKQQNNKFKGRIEFRWLPSIRKWWSECTYLPIQTRNACCNRSIHQIHRCSGLANHREIRKPQYLAKVHGYIRCSILRKAQRKGRRESASCQRIRMKISRESISFLLCFWFNSKEIFSASFEWWKIAKEYCFWRKSKGIGRATY